ncbi:MAG: hypothetical protein ACOCWA_07515 [Bacteroidota bacterium]
MKLLSKYLIAVILLVAGFTAKAQHHQMNDKTQKKKDPVMQQHMMDQRAMMHQGMMSMKGMGCPMCGNMVIENTSMDNYAAMVNMLPNAADSLTFSKSQIENFIDMRAEYKKQQIDYMAELSKQQIELKNLLEKNASAENVRQKMEGISDIRLDMKMAAYKTANEMKQEFSEEQQQKLKKLMHMHTGMMRDRDMIYHEIMREFMR